MSSVEIQARLEALQNGIHELRDLIEQLRTFKHQNGSVPLYLADETTELGQLNAEILQLRRDAEDELLDLKEEIANFPAGKITRPQKGLELLTKEMNSLRHVLKDAQVESNKNYNAAQHTASNPVVETLIRYNTAPEELEAGARENPTKSSTFSLAQKQAVLNAEEQKTIGASNTYLLALRQTHDMISTEFSKSQYAQEALAESSAALAQLTDSYGSLDGMLKSSKDLLGTLLSSQKSDTWYLQTSLVILLSTLAWLVFRRILYGPAWWFIYLPLRLVFGVGWTVTKTIVPPGQKSTNPPEVSILLVTEVSSLTDENVPTIIMEDSKASLVIKPVGPSTIIEKEEIISEQIAKIIDGETPEPQAEKPKPEDPTPEKLIMPDTDNINKEEAANMDLGLQPEPIVGIEKDEL